jgi:hypothetical protein
VTNPPLPPGEGDSPKASGVRAAENQAETSRTEMTTHYREAGEALRIGVNGRTHD